MRKKLRVAGYARVSTDEQKKYGYSIQAQKELKELRKELDNLNYIFIKKRMPVSTYERLYAETEDKIKRLESFKPQSTDHLSQFLNSGWRSIYDNLTRENKRTLWRNVLDSVHVSPDKIEVFFK